MRTSQDDYFALVKRPGIVALSVLAVPGSATAVIAQEAPIRANNAPWILNTDGEASKHMVVRKKEPPPPPPGAQQGAGEQAARCPSGLQPGGSRPMAGLSQTRPTQRCSPARWGICASPCALTVALSAKGWSIALSPDYLGSRD